METDPYNVLGNVRARTANEMLHAFKYVACHESELELPIYAHHGTKDRLANLGVSHTVILSMQTLSGNSVVIHTLVSLLGTSQASVHSQCQEGHDYTSELARRENLNNNCQAGLNSVMASPAGCEAPAQKRSQQRCDAL